MFREFQIRNGFKEIKKEKTKWLKSKVRPFKDCKKIKELILKLERRKCWQH